MKNKSDEKIKDDVRKILNLKIAKALGYKTIGRNTWGGYIWKCPIEVLSLFGECYKGAYPDFIGNFENLKKIELTVRLLRPYWGSEN